MRRRSSEYTREKLPLDWASLQQNLGSVYAHARRSRHGNRLSAEVGGRLSQALEVYTATAAPLDFASIEHESRQHAVDLG